MKLDLKILLAVLLLTLGLMGMKSLQPETMPLVPMMQLLLEDVNAVNQGIYTEDFKMIEKGAKNIAEHPVMTEEDKRLVKTVLGEEIKQFVAFDMIVHHHADSMAMTARQRNMEGVLKHYRIIQQGCVDCHTSYRTEISKARKKADE